MYLDGNIKATLFMCNDSATWYSSTLQLFEMTFLKIYYTVHDANTVPVHVWRSRMPDVMRWAQYLKCYHNNNGSKLWLTALNTWTYNKREFNATRRRTCVTHIKHLKNLNTGQPTHDARIRNRIRISSQTSGFGSDPKHQHCQKLIGKGILYYYISMISSQKQQPEVDSAYNPLLGRTRN
jgi:hypothetical protein